jgi:hypothetical protein
MANQLVPLYPPTMQTFEGRDVIASSVAITNAGDGLSKALQVEPGELRLGDKVFIVLEAEVTKVRYEEVKDTDTLRRVHTCRTDTATFVDEELVAQVLDEQRRKIEKAQGVERLPINDDTDDDGEPF